MDRRKLATHLNTLLNVNAYQDYCPNGLQVAGKDNIKKIITGVTACQALIDTAAEKNADAIIVHHGFFWKNEPETIVGIKKNRIKSLLTHDINLFAYHLPLDGHPTLGNNIQLGKRLGVQNIEAIDLGLGPSIGLQGTLSHAHSASELSETIASALNRKPFHIASDKPHIQRIGWCTGAAQNGISHAYLANCDAYISGEISETTVHIARELNIHYFAAGHHATERYGVKALGEHLANEFGLDVEFVDIDNPV